MLIRGRVLQLTFALAEKLAAAVAAAGAAPEGGLAGSLLLPALCLLLQWLASQPSALRLLPATEQSPMFICMSVPSARLQGGSS